MSLFTQRHYEIVADRVGKELARYGANDQLARDIIIMFVNFFGEDNGRFSDTRFEKAVLTSASKHGWSPDKEEVMT